jgi:hypothetical protein
MGPAARALPIGRALARARRQLINGRGLSPRPFISCRRARERAYTLRRPEAGPRAPQRALRVEQATPSPPPIHIVSQGERAQRERGAKRSNL